MTPTESNAGPPIAINAVPLRLVLAGDDPGLSVVSAQASSAMSGLFRVTMIVQHADPSLSPSSFVSRNATVHLDQEPGAPSLAGVIRAFRLLTIEPAGLSRYEIILVPALALLGLRTDAFIFSNQNAAEITGTMLDTYDAAVPAYRVVGGETLPSHEYRVQYLETDLDCLFRIWAEDGIATYFDVFSGCELVLLTDTRSQAVEPAFALPFAPPSALNAPTHHVYAIEPTSAQAAVHHSVEDLWLDRPTFEAFARAPDVDTPLVRYLFEPGIATTYAQLSTHAEALFWAEYGAANTITVRSTAYVPAGYRLRIDGSPRKEGETELLVVEVASSWSGGHDGARIQREHMLVCVPLTVRFVPKRPAKKRIAGLQKASIVGDGEIDVDELGRVLCAFRWSEDCVTRRVLVSQAWAGPGYGHYVHPRVGDEVLIAYLDGDPNEPIVIGRVNNAIAPPALTLPKEKTVSLWRTRSSPGGDGFNEIRMDDLAGEEMFSMHAQRDFQTVVERNSNTQIKSNLVVHTVENATASTGVSSAVTVPKYLIAVDEIIIASTNSLFCAAYRTDEIAYVLNVNVPNEYHHNSLWQMDGGAFEVYTSSQALLQCEGAQVLLRPGSIELSIGGASIKLTPGNITAIAGLIDLNP